MPLGVGGRLAGQRWRVILFGALLSTTVELLQLRVIPGRDASVLDVIANTIGTACGVLFADYTRTLTTPTPRVATRLVGAAGPAVALVLLLGGWAMAPAPGRSPLWGQRTPELGGEPAYAGTLLSGRVDDRELPSARLPNDSAIRDLMHEGEIRVDATVRPAPIPVHGAPIIRIADACGREILMLAQNHEELVLRYRMRATALGLNTPGFVLPDAFAPRASDEVIEGEVDTLAARVRGGRVHLSALKQGVTRSTDLHASLASSWTFFVPWYYQVGPRSAAISRLCFALLLLPVGYWAGIALGSKRGNAVTVAVAALLVATIALAPVALELPPTGLLEWLAVILGASLGLTLGRWRASRRN